MSEREIFLAVFEKLGQAVTIRDPYTGEHSQRSTSFAIRLGRQLQLTDGELEWLRLATPLHDLGKIGIDDATLRKPGPLTPAEFEVMRTHTTLGATIIEKIPESKPVLQVVRSHHERWDGTGYPDGLKGEEIPRLARIVAVVEAFDAMVFDTPYRLGLSVEFAFALIEREQERQFDPEVVTAFLQIREQMIQEMNRFKNT